MSLRSILIGLACISPLAVNASTVEGFIQGSVSHTQFDEPASYSVAFGPTETLEQEDGRAIRAFGFGGQQGTTSGQYAVNAITGQLRLGFDARVVSVDGVRGSAGSFGRVSLTESFRVVGSGTVTVGMSVSAKWGSSNFGFDACVSYLGESLDANCLGRNHVDDGVSGLISSELLKSTIFVPDGTDSLFDFTWFLQGGVAVSGGLGASEGGFLDAMNTANIFVTTIGDVTATPITAGFLSDPAFGKPDPIAPVPLPASGLILVGAIAGLVAVRRFKKSDRD